jgi:hypothetical protein
MIRKNSHLFAESVAAAIISLALAYKFGNNGYEVFITICIALGLWATWLLLLSVRAVCKSKEWLLIKCINCLLLFILWLIIICAALLATSKSAYSPSVIIPQVSWGIVVLGVILYVIPRINVQSFKISAQRLMAEWLATLYAMLVLFIAVVSYFNKPVTSNAVVLVLAVQLQYLMYTLVTRTNYLQQSYQLAVKANSKWGLQHSEWGTALVIFLVGLPFSAPLVIVLLAS